ncbi:hypothetical protein PAXRUDRAFT_784007 [Paxillus rubicundulus Ve08.2h10]|uniref:Uncharacterized protein n=1 Tax=Paxillus rubicundulus Ve08.2h10 TaxID=930991 RepID=A0A0D0BX90_9AGAM|nr:hypothetical protein PAXRUDRAFT_784007 [Paxillus rubicundulus Ve08.2h10]
MKTVHLAILPLTGPPNDLHLRSSHLAKTTLPCHFHSVVASMTTYPHSHNILSLNSDDEDPTLHKCPKMTTPHNLRPTVSAQESDPKSAKMQGYHSRSSPCHTPTSEESGDSSSNFTGVTSQSQAGNSSRSRKQVCKTPADKITNQFADMSDALVKQLQETRLAKLESKWQK